MRIADLILIYSLHLNFFTINAASLQETASKIVQGNPDSRIVAPWLPLIVRLLPPERTAPETNAIIADTCNKCPEHIQNSYSEVFNRCLAILHNEESNERCVARSLRFLAEIFEKGGHGITQQSDWAAFLYRTGRSSSCIQVGFTNNHNIEGKRRKIISEFTYMPVHPQNSTVQEIAERLITQYPHSGQIAPWLPVLNKIVPVRTATPYSNIVIANACFKRADSLDFAHQNVRSRCIALLAHLQNTEQNTFSEEELTLREHWRFYARDFLAKIYETNGHGIRINLRNAAFIRNVQNSTQDILANFLQ